VSKKPSVPSPLRKQGSRKASKKLDSRVLPAGIHKKGLNAREDGTRTARRLSFSRCFDRWRRVLYSLPLRLVDPFRNVTPHLDDFPCDNGFLIFPTDLLATILLGGCAGTKKPEAPLCAIAERGESSRLPPCWKIGLRGFSERAVSCPWRLRAGETSVPTARQDAAQGGMRSLIADSFSGVRDGSVFHAASAYSSFFFMRSHSLPVPFPLRRVRANPPRSFCP